MDSPLTERFKYFFTKINILRNAGWEPPLEPVELRPLPVAKGYGQGGAMKQEALPFKAG
jgi:putative transposase